jgi:hypothetical protein
MYKSESKLFRKFLIAHGILHKLIKCYPRTLIEQRIIEHTIINVFIIEMSFHRMSKLLKC